MATVCSNEELDGAELFKVYHFSGRNAPKKLYIELKKLQWVALLSFAGALRFRAVHALVLP